MDKLKHIKTDKIIIAGPCALESREQLQKCVKKLKSLDVKVVRACIWKPRTLPGWEGLGKEGLEILLEETIPYGLIPGTEVINVEHAEIVVSELKKYDNNPQMIVWIGARNQNHIEQQKIAKILAKEENILLMFKNQAWDDQKHWLGIYEHIVSVGFPKERILICHRGFCPGKMPNPKNLRNLPDFKMALDVKEKTQVPMIIDPSHIAGSRDNLLDIMQESEKNSFDGYIIEVHPDPDNAKTDAKQQLSLEEFEKLLISLQLSKEELCIR
jgi:chorismate mutase